MRTELKDNINLICAGSWLGSSVLWGLSGQPVIQAIYIILGLLYLVAWALKVWYL